jgi:hypothetical protein
MDLCPQSDALRVRSSVVHAQSRAVEPCLLDSIAVRLEQVTLLPLLLQVRGDGCKSSVQFVRAQGDLDCDGKYGTYEIRGSVNSVTGEVERSATCSSSIRWSRMIR